MNRPLNIKIIGAGTTGSLLALSLANYGNKVTLFESMKQEDLINRSRAYAINHSSKKLLSELGIWYKLKNRLTGFSTLYVSDYVINKTLKFSTSDLVKSNDRDNSIGWIIEHKDLMSTIIKQIKNSNNINLQFSSETDYESKGYDIVVATDGYKSNALKMLKIRRISRFYNQGCLSLKVALRGIISSNDAYEIFRDEGPLAILPMGNDKYQIIWSAPMDLCNKRAELKSSILLDKLASILPIGIEPDLLLDKPIAIPIPFSIASRITKGNFFLLGESAHTFHPVGGQGLNLCWRDIYHFSKLINLKRIGIHKLRFKFSLYRYYDIAIIAFITDMLVRITSNRNFIAIQLRRLGFKLTTSNSSLRRFILRIMTNGPF